MLTARLGDPLGRREFEILGLISKGCTLVEASNLLGISFHTARWYMRNIGVKLGTVSTSEAVAWLVQYNWAAQMAAANATIAKLRSQLATLSKAAHVLTLNCDRAAHGEDDGPRLRAKAELLHQLEQYSL